jgi:outer membrane protein insertion porin family
MPPLPEPWLGGKKPNSLSLSAYYSISNGSNPNLPEQQQSKLKVVGASVGLGKRLYVPDDFFSLFNQSTMNITSFRITSWFPGSQRTSQQPELLRHALT